jgi:hypothetical protein
MIVWGGRHLDETTGDSRRNRGARYDPANDSWTPTSTGASVPAGREGHLAVWTGTEMIVWGGYPSPALLSGGRYHPVTDSWTTISAGANAPFAYFPHKAVWTGSEMIVWANPGGRYNPVTDSWSPMSMSASVPFHSGYTAVWTGTEVIVWAVTATTTCGSTPVDGTTRRRTLGRSHRRGSTSRPPVRTTRPSGPAPR